MVPDAKERKIKQSRSLHVRGTCMEYRDSNFVHEDLQLELLRLTAFIAIVVSSFFILFLLFFGSILMIMMH